MGNFPLRNVNSRSHGPLDLTSVRVGLGESKAFEKLGMKKGGMKVRDFDPQHFHCALSHHFS